MVSPLSARRPGDSRLSVVDAASWSWRQRASLLCVLLATVGLLALWVRAAAVALDDLRPPRQPIDGAVAGRLGLRDVAFETADGLTLRGWYVPPRGAGTVVLVHGQRASRAQLLRTAARLEGRGLGVLLFDLRAHGESGGELATSGDREQLDLEAALAFVRLQPEAAGRPVGALGFSVGGIALAEVAARDPGVRAVVLEATPPTLEEDLDADCPRGWTLERWVGVMVHRLKGVQVDSVRPVDRLCAIAPRPLLLVYGEFDPGISAAQRARMLAAACGPKGLWVVPGAGHGGFLEAQPEAFEQRVVSFLATALGGAAGHHSE